MIGTDDQQKKDRQQAADAAEKQDKIDNANGALNSSRTVADKYSVPEEAGAAGKAEKEAAVSVDPSVRLRLPLPLFPRTNCCCAAAQGVMAALQECLLLVLCLVVYVCTVAATV